MLGRGSKYADMCYKEGYIGADLSIHVDISDSLFENWRHFNKKFIPMWMANEPGKSKTAAGLACGALWTIAKGLNIGDVVLCPSGHGFYYVGTISGGYYYVPDTELPHRREVSWQEKVIYRKDMSLELQHSIGSIGTCSNATNFAEEIDTLLQGPTKTPEVKQPEKAKAVKTYAERDLHKLFCSYLRDQGIYAKTIFHEQSSTKSDNTQNWVHPDIVGVTFEEFTNEATLSLLKATEPKETVQLYSYELKKKIDTDYTLKQCYFQALSNSSWANYGYLVAFEINEDLEDEMKRLNNAFGIGIILMQPNDSKIICSAKEKPLDYNTIEKLNNLNQGFCTFISKLSKVLNATKEYTADAKLSFEKICDKVFESDDELETYCKEHNIPF